MKKKNKKNFFYPLKENTFDNQDLKTGIDVIRSKNVTMSKKTFLFEKLFKKKLRSVVLQWLTLVHLLIYLQSNV
jgi:hypothetical protein